MARTRKTAVASPENGQSYAGTGAAPFTACDGSNGNDMLNNGRRMLMFKNGDSNPTTVTFTGVTDENSRTGNVTLTVPASVVNSGTPSTTNAVNGVCYAGPFPEHLFGSLLLIDYSSATDLSFAAFELPGRI